MSIEGVHKVIGKKSGPTVAVFAGVHGNEKAGVYALRELAEKIKITRGKVYLVFANPEAIAANVRMLTKNLNRCFFADNDDEDPEDFRARELMSILDECDALLDLHMFYGDGKPFAICEEASLDVARIFDVDIISTNWTHVEPGATDGYMHQKGKIGVCLECGPIAESKQQSTFAKNAVYQFLAYYKMHPVVAPASTSKKRIVEAQKAVYKKSETFELLPGFKDFDELTEGQVIARDKEHEFVARKRECIIFPHYQARVGEEGYIIGRVVDK